MAKRNKAEHLPKDGSQAKGHDGSNAGRPPEEFKKKMRELGTSPKAIAFFTALINGDPIEEKVLEIATGETKNVMVAAPPKVRLDALKECWDRGFGKAPMSEEDQTKPPAILVFPAPMDAAKWLETYGLKVA